MKGNTVKGNRPYGRATDPAAKSTRPFFNKGFPTPSSHKLWPRSPNSTRSP